MKGDKQIKPHLFGPHWLWILIHLLAACKLLLLCSWEEEVDQDNNTQ